MRELTRSELRRVARAAGVPEADPVMFDGRAEKLVRAGIELGARVVENLLQERDALQARIDALMLEYCPDEMTAEQRQAWEAALAVKVEGK